MNTEEYSRNERFSEEPTARIIAKPWGWEIVWTPPGLPYVGKILHIFEGHRLSLQVHEEKSESWLLVSGKAAAVWQTNAGRLEEYELNPGQGYTCERGRIHRLIGLSDCDIVEVSTPEVGVTRRFDDDYGRKDEAASTR